MREILADSSVMVDFLQGSLNTAEKDLLNNSLVSISILTYLEVSEFFYKTGKVKDLEFLKQRLKSFETFPITYEICDEAAKIHHSGKMSLADAIILATARIHNLKVVTSDSDMKGMPEVIFLKAKK
ncbi:MAG: PIN domain-containing protein [Candidatus Micrarchaeota archaeon]